MPSSKPTFHKRGYVERNGNMAWSVVVYPYERYDPEGVEFSLGDKSVYFSPNVAKSIADALYAAADKAAQDMDK